VDLGWHYFVAIGEHVRGATYRSMANGGRAGGRS
jgi:hypothetical protein